MDPRNPKFVYNLISLNPSQKLLLIDIIFSWLSFGHLTMLQAFVPKQDCTNKGIWLILCAQLHASIMVCGLSMLLDKSVTCYDYFPTSAREVFGHNSLSKS